MSNGTSALPIEPVVSWPREAEIGRSYLVTIDLRCPQRSEEWAYEEEELRFGFSLDGAPHFTCEALSDPSVVLHRFGGTYGPARFVVATGPAVGPGSLWLTISNRWGFPVRTVKLPAEVVTGPATEALTPGAVPGTAPPRSADVADTGQSGYLSSATSAPDFVSLTSGEPFYVGDDLTFLLAVSIGLPAGAAPVESVQLLVQRTPDVSIHGRARSLQTLRPGETRELVQRLKISNSALRAGEIAISLSLRYRSASGSSAETPVRTLAAVLRPASRFTTIANPFIRYSGGTPVDEQEMFFGRQDVLERIYRQLTSEPLGQCVTLYGPKQSGKSSVVRQLMKRLRRPNLAVYLSLGALDTARAERSFIKICINSLYDRLVHDFDITDVLEHDWPRESQIEASPVESFRRSVLVSTRLLEPRKGWQDVRPIFLIDEFTYIYEYIREGLLTPAFMRLWKTLLESRSFNALLVGQDTMPRFREAYPNQLALTHDERISYLSEGDARALAEVPIMMAGESRYKGSSLDRLISLTGGSAYYTQIFCDHLIRHLNQNRLLFITESVVDDVLGQLTTGPSALSMDKFDPLITVAAESVALVPRERYLALLVRVALNPRITAQDMGPEDELIAHDLLARDVLQRDTRGRLRIRVGLFAEWLRTNSVGAVE
jgi:hypothetical protein